ncbi:copper amine oxidase N-terminal domain-containing protein [Aneurinibacillus tyrosinisolvens]|uniref:copper amine oxidase N-terminal domain-containing protein n=1 Tax=Aneurinibacillus tyrosinisolvens TaxID=1443435 RepID=UPI0006993A38|nr:copper amine oxidase N-terminal domain-containing protein [Aneurinibacillus tyrosinisolvens]
MKKKLVTGILSTALLVSGAASAFAGTVQTNSTASGSVSVHSAQKQDGPAATKKTGLENALNHVKNEHAKQVILSNIQKQQNNVTTGDTINVTTGDTVMVTPVIIKNEIIVKLNGKNLSFDQKPVVVQGRTLVPLRTIFEALGIKIDWDGKTGTVKAGKGKNKVTVKIGSTTATVNGKAVKLEQKAQVINQRTMIPLRFISESFEANVKWDAASHTVIITQK